MMELMERCVTRSMRNFKKKIEPNKSSKLQFVLRCKCCLEGGPLKDMWSEYNTGDEIVVYGVRLTECFALSKQEPCNETERICDNCIKQLQDAFAFKNKVLASEQLLLQNILEEETNINQDCSEQIFKEEQLKMEEDDEQLESSEELYILQEEFKGEEETSEDIIYLQDSESQGDEEHAEYLELEYLEDEDNGDKKSETVQVSQKRNWPKKKKKQDRRSRKRYTNEEIRQCIEAVKSKKMTRSEAARFYNVHIKTLGRKIRAEAKKLAAPPKAVEELKQPSQERQNKFLHEIKNILTYTNATPYKTKSGRYCCGYCLIDNPDRNYFDDPDKFRIHIRTSHAEERLGSIEGFMSPSYLNEVLKLDIEKLTCIVCCIDIASWNDMFVHLKEVHDVELNEAYTRVIPYCLTNDLRCALCKESYPSYHILDAHMNAHYNNYICGECGDTYLAETRLKKHLETHSLEQYPCHVCKKVFTLEKYRRKHFDYVHNPKDDRFKCMYCSEKFRADHARIVHMKEKHKEKVKKDSCDICKKTFSWRPSYTKHMRVVHGKMEKKHKCQLCDKEFMMKYELRNHESWHRDDASYVCDICDKKFSSKNYLQKHYQTHVEEVTVVVVGHE